MAQMWPPKRNTAFDLYFTIRDADGDPVTGAAAADSEVSKDGGAFADCTNEFSEIGNGLYKLTLTSTEMTADVVCVQAKTSTSGAKTPQVVIYTTESTWDEGIDVKTLLAAALTQIVDTMQDKIHTGVLQAGTTGSATLATSASAVDDQYTEGLLIVISPAGVAQVAFISDYVGSTRVATITPNWGTTPDNTYRYVALGLG